MHSHTGDLGEAVGSLLIEIKIKRAKEELLLLNLRSTTRTTTLRTNNSNGSKLMHTSPSTSTSTDDRVRASITPPPAFVFNTGLHMPWLFRNPMDIEEPIVVNSAQSNNDENDEEQDDGDNVEQDKDLKLNEVLAKEIELVA
ncbi:hypothetical protein BDZ89DRAFT_1033301 [Hymenopellis radicata]|nr:hypothetical protein BDZ89DRAFT_1033301 [Hymenopellis radicata]